MDALPRVLAVRDGFDIGRALAATTDEEAFMDQATTKWDFELRRAVPCGAGFPPGSLCCFNKEPDPEDDAVANYCVKIENHRLLNILLQSLHRDSIKEGTWCASIDEFYEWKEWYECRQQNSNLFPDFSDALPKDSFGGLLLVDTSLCSTAAKTNAGRLRERQREAYKQEFEALKRRREQEEFEERRRELARERERELQSLREFSAQFNKKVELERQRDPPRQRDESRHDLRERLLIKTLPERGDPGRGPRARDLGDRPWSSAPAESKLVRFELPLEQAESHLEQRGPRQLELEEQTRKAEVLARRERRREEAERAAREEERAALRRKDRKYQANLDEFNEAMKDLEEGKRFERIARHFKK